MSTRIPSWSTPQCEQLSVSTVGAAPDAMGLRGNSPYPLTMEQNLPSFTYNLSQRGEKQLDTKLLLKRGDAAVANTALFLWDSCPTVCSCGLEVLERWEAGEAATVDGSKEFRRLQGQTKYRESRFQKGTDSDTGSPVRFFTGKESRGVLSLSHTHT